jgi:hypothetical protein
MPSVLWRVGRFSDGVSPADAADRYARRAA